MMHLIDSIFAMVLLGKSHSTEKTRKIWRTLGFPDFVSLVSTQPFIAKSSGDITVEPRYWFKKMWYWLLHTASHASHFFTPCEIDVESSHYLAQVSSNFLVGCWNFLASYSLKTTRCSNPEFPRCFERLLQRVVASGATCKRYGRRHSLGWCPLRRSCRVGWSCFQINTPYGSLVQL